MNKDTTMLFHHGVPSETVEFLTTSLLKSPKVLSEFGITVRGPKTYQGTMQKALAQLERRAFSDDTREILFARLTQGHEPKRLLLSNRHLFVPTSDIFVGGEFFGTTAQKRVEVARAISKKPIGVLFGNPKPSHVHSE